MGSVDGLDSFTGVIGKLSELIGYGKKLEDIFNGSASLTIGDIRNVVKQELAAALSVQAMEQQIDDASATLQAVQQFLSIDYVNAVNNHRTQDGLLGLLNDTTIGPLVSDMETKVNGLKTWMDGVDLRSAAQGIPVSLGLYLYLSIVHRERAKYAANAADQQTSLANMRSYARAGAQDIGQRLNKLVSARLNSFGYLSDDNPNITDAGGIPIKNYCTIDSLHDTWFDAWLFAFKASDDSTTDYAGALHWVLRASRNVLWSGAETDAEDLSRSFTDGWLRVPQTLGSGSVPWTENFRDTCSAENRSFGQLVQNARTSLLGLDAIAFGYVGSEQDNWSCCSSCGGLYYAGLPSVCPASKESHVHERPSGNYVLRYNPTQPAPRPMSDNWRWCKNCSGLFKDWGNRLCPAGGAHDSSASWSYELDVGPVPADLGLRDTQDNWRWCGRCSALHYGSGASVCPAGGPHDSGGSEDYWLNTLGVLPQPS